MNDLDNKTEKELLAELVDLQKKGSRRAALAVIISAFAAAILLAAAIILVPRTVSMINDTNRLVTEALGAVENIDKVVRDASGLIEENAEGITDAIQRVDAVDFESLNDSIKSLSDILTPLANFFNVFK